MTYQSPYNQFAAPYYDAQQRMPQNGLYGQQMPYQMPQMQQQIPGVVGRVVNGANEITANDVPMNGSFAFFPMQDMSAIYAKSWNADGTIRTIAFKPVLTDGASNLSPEAGKSNFDLPEETRTAFMARFDSLEKAVNRISDELLGNPGKKDGVAK